jgi:hypothetical protein
LRAKLRLPRLSDTFVGGVRRDMLGRGFSLVSTPALLDEDLRVRLNRRRMVLPYHGKLWLKLPRLARYACWLEELLARALPEEPVSLAALELRHEPAGSVDEDVDQLHADGSYIRSVLTLYGPTTLYWDGDAEWPVPSGQTLLMTAQDRARAVGVPCTLHRRPGAGPERAVIVCSLAPRQEQPGQANVFRQVAQAV